MTRRQKLIERIRARPPEADYRDVAALLEDFGWHFDRQRGSHVIYIKSGELPLTIPLVEGRRVKRKYLAKICIRLDLDS